ncbi:MAG: ABC transporter ATP-binding protein/permease [Lachnospiraceae bacterium]|jgi:ABC-type multidrug transport system fused ATPase/permease subunit|nr:ABC transporter ATP-binding protein/permease [Lachnospiraceae bacterium]MCH4028131.1 ABC transporter ATP-binding protein/permease [Lachnospiraceae bacterium]MCH4065975.1 ABC transporter ATP-binding protein/permease [Lachnospiraceae bacterium]MCH4112011.1 ABC transporter ATP-binding protein/permease [Lachnospiraceae bacterium]MCI1353507.1 ABC transporter ATP-binding protein/permease [Lachnospiraceae bacterium]
MKRLFSYMKADLGEAILAPFFKMLEAIFELFVPIIVADMIDRGVAGRDVKYLIHRCILLLVLAACGLAFSITAQYFSAKVATGTAQRMRDDLFSHIMTLSWRQIDDLGTSALITRMTSDINTIQNGVNMFLRLFLRSPFVVFGAMIMAFTVDTKTAMIFVVVVPVLFLIVFAILLITMPLYRKVQKQLDAIMQTTRENLLGVRVVRAFNRQESEKKAFDSEADDFYHRQIFAGKISALLNPLTLVVINIGIIAILWTGGRQVYTGALSQGKLIAQINYMSQILTELIKLANLIILLSRAMASERRVNDIFNVTNDREDGTNAFPASQNGGASIDFNDVSFRYEKDAEPALSGITFHADAGSTIGIIGGTGSGKSSIVNLIPRFYDADSGSVCINGMDVRSIRENDLRHHIGLVPQKAVLFRGSLRDNMKWGRDDASDSDIYRAIDIAQAREFVDSKKQGLDLMIEQEGRNLSGGQKQRLTIARAIVRNPEILILDDSASALDFATDADLRKALRTEEGTRTVILVSQRVSTVRAADQILVMEDGRLAGAGTHRELLQNCREYQEICASQMTPEEIRSDLAGSDTAKASLS